MAHLQESESVVWKEKFYHTNFKLINLNAMAWEWHTTFDIQSKFSWCNCIVNFGSVMLFQLTDHTSALKSKSARWTGRDRMGKEGGCLKIDWTDYKASECMAGDQKICSAYQNSLWGHGEPNFPIPMAGTSPARLSVTKWLTMMAQLIHLPPNNTSTTTHVHLLLLKKKQNQTNFFMQCCN